MVTIQIYLAVLLMLFPMVFLPQTHRETDLRKMTSVIQPCYSINF